MRAIKSTEESTVFYIVRHGETLWNEKGLIQGHDDSPLSLLGEKQARAVAQVFTMGNVSKIVSSDLGRAVRTSEIIADPSCLQIETDSRLRERNLGIMQRLTTLEFKEKHPKAFEQFSQGDPDYRIEGGESIRDRYERSIACLNDLAKVNHGQEIIIVTHGGILDSFFRHSVGLPLSQKRSFTLYNASISTVEISQGAWKLISWGYTDHLSNVESIDDWYGTGV